MKLLIIGNTSSKCDKLSIKISDYYEIKINKVNEYTTKNEINNLVKKNKEWIIEGYNENNIEILFNLAETIIFIDLNKGFFDKTISIDKEKIYELLKKHIRKGIILKSNKDIKKYLKSMYESNNY